MDGASYRGPDGGDAALFPFGPSGNVAPGPRGIMAPFQPIPHMMQPHQQAHPGAGAMPAPPLDPAMMGSGAAPSSKGSFAIPVTKDTLNFREILPGQNFIFGYFEQPLTFDATF